MSAHARALARRGPRDSTRRRRHFPVVMSRVDARKRARDDDASHAAAAADQPQRRLENDKFEAYYREQGVCRSEEDFRAMMARFREPLPLTFRVNASGRLVGATMRRLEGEVLPALSRERGMKPPKAVAWYPNRMSWQIDVSQSASLKQSDSEAILRYTRF